MKMVEVRIRKPMAPGKYPVARPPAKPGSPFGGSPSENKFVGSREFYVIMNGAFIIVALILIVVLTGGGENNNSEVILETCDPERFCIGDLNEI